MKLKCKVLTKTEACTHAYYCNRLPEITIDIPDYDPEIHEDEYEDEDNYIDIVGGDMIEDIFGITIKGFTWEVI